MKKISLLIIAMGTSMFSFAETVTVEVDGKVQYVSDSSSVEIEAVGSGAVSALLDTVNAEILIVYNDGSVFVKKTDATAIVQLAESIADKVTTAAWSDNNTILLTRTSGATQNVDAREWR